MLTRKKIRFIVMINLNNYKYFYSVIIYYYSKLIFFKVYSEKKEFYRPNFRIMQTANCYYICHGVGSLLHAYTNKVLDIILFANLFLFLLSCVDYL